MQFLQKIAQNIARDVEYYLILYAFINILPTIILSGTKIFFARHGYMSFDV